MPLVFSIKKPIGWQGKLMRYFLKSFCIFPVNKRIEMFCPNDRLLLDARCNAPWSDALDLG